MPRWPRIEGVGTRCFFNSTSFPLLEAGDDDVLGDYYIYNYLYYYYYYFGVQERNEEKREGPIQLQSLLDEVEEGRGNRASHAPMRWKVENSDARL